MDRPKVIGLFCLFLLIFIVFAVNLTTAVNDPFFDGDAGYRLHSARMPIVRLENRIWLPMLQLHIWLFYLLHLPYYTFKIIPCFYFFVALLFLCLLAYRLNRGCNAGLLFTLLIVFSFSFQSYLKNLSILLCQESIDLALFYLLLWGGALELKKNKWLLPIGAAALLTRESFWIYLLVITVLNWKRIISSNGYRISFMFLWGIPLLWLSSIPVGYWYFEGRFPAFPVEWPLGINKEGGRAISHVVESSRSLAVSIVSSKALILVAGAIIVWAIGAVYRRMRGQDVIPINPFRSQFAIFSLLSIGIVYSLVILFNPWEATFANQRVTVPLLAHAFVWSSILFAETRFLTGLAKVSARSILVATLILTMNLNVSTWIPPDNSQPENAIAEIEQFVRAAGHKKQANVCFFGVDYWQALEIFVGATLYARRYLHKRAQDSGNCDLIIGPPGVVSALGEDFIKRGDYNLRGRSYRVLVRE
ncbi:hypothetical protein L0222_24830 [bacterium]|nr:hypothetical protein [bacterium]MCI0604427.1 hypothetical protein [bacterium]